MSDQNEFIQLKCPNCGGQLELTQKQFEGNFAEIDDVVIFIGGDLPAEEAKCKYCGSEFVRKQRFEHAGGNTVVATNGGVAVGGNVSDSVIITGSSKRPQKGKYNIIIGSARGMSIGDNAKVGDETGGEDDDPQ